MKTNRIVLWTVFGITGFAAVLLLLKAMTLFGLSNYVYIQHGPGRGGHNAFYVLRKVEDHQSLAFLASAWIAIKFAVLAAAIWLWSKSSGILRGVSMVVAGLALMSLLSPICGALLVIAMLILKPKNKGYEEVAARGEAFHYGSRLFSGRDSMQYMNSSSESGSFLDEWERKNKN
ncbi:hypothetical protein [Candidatus Pristimantibacillus sp. PTI5]|uniref:hypothetical protein n=1 Tax=Candidatus Pristimantibacillus sp. PTI5 TaxID=3400422 RepID=UPI003B0274CF